MIKVKKISEKLVGIQSIPTMEKMSYFSTTFKVRAEADVVKIETDDISFVGLYSDFEIDAAGDDNFVAPSSAAQAAELLSEFVGNFKSGSSGGSGGGSVSPNMFPDYANMETINRISTYNGTWTADRDGYVFCRKSFTIQSTSGVAYWFNVRINSKTIYMQTEFVSSVTAGNVINRSTVLAVKKGDVISFEGMDTPAAAMQHFCYFIPPIVQTSDMTLVNSLLTMGPPNYSARETVNRISANNGTWTVDRDGYVSISVQNATNTGSAFVWINNKAVGQAYSGSSANAQAMLNDVYAVKVGDVVQLGVDAGSASNVSCYYIPPVANASLYVPTAQTQLINFPNQWTPDVEYDFGNNLYGKRITGTITATAGVSFHMQIPTPGIRSIVDRGGWIKRGIDEYQWALETTGALSSTPTVIAIWSRIVAYEPGGRFNFDSFSTESRTGNANSQYDVWVKYTK